MFSSINVHREFHKLIYYNSSVLHSGTQRVLVIYHGDKCIFYIHKRHTAQGRDFSYFSSTHQSMLSYIR